MDGSAHFPLLFNLWEAKMAYYLTFHFETISEIGIKRSDLLIFCIAFILELF